MKNYTILLAEDEKGTQEELRDILGFLCKSVYIASDGLEAKSLYEEHKPDLIITDIVMPKLSGLEFVKSIRKSDTDTSIVIVSAHTDVDYLLLATELQLLKYLVKPITKSKLYKVFELFKKHKEKYDITLSQSHTFFPKQYCIIADKTTYKLTSKEADFLTKLLTNKNLITYYELEELLCLETLRSENAIRQFIKKLRVKLPKNYIRNVQGTGYIIDKIYL